MANSSNNFFVNIGKNLQDSNNTTSNNSFSDYLKHPNIYSVFLKPVTKHEIITIVKNI